MVRMDEPDAKRTITMTTMVDAHDASKHQDIHRAHRAIVPS